MVSLPDRSAYALHWCFRLRENIKKDRRKDKAGIMNWLECAEIEAIPGKMGGRPVVKGTRIEPEAILIDEEYGRTPEQTHESFPRCRSILS
jgi:uncharacterized protein (DUF433 family)